MDTHNIPDHLHISIGVNWERVAFNESNERFLRGFKNGLWDSELVELEYEHLGGHNKWVLLISGDDDNGHARKKHFEGGLMVLRFELLTCSWTCKCLLKGLREGLNVFATEKPNGFILELRNTDVASIVVQGKAKWRPAKNRCRSEITKRKGDEELKSLSYVSVCRIIYDCSQELVWILCVLYWVGPGPCFWHLVSLEPRSE